MEWELRFMGMFDLIICVPIMLFHISSHFARYSAKNHNNIWQSIYVALRRKYFRHIVYHAIFKT